MKSMQQRAIDKGFTFPYLIDADQKIYPQYGATKTPHVYILESTTRGPVVRYIGGIDDNYKDATLVKTNFVEDAIESLKNGGAIKFTKTKAIGCSIKQ
jgi:peroxiredoxin